MLFRTITDHVIGEGKPKIREIKTGVGFAPTTMMRLNSQVQQYGGFTPGPRVFGRTPKLPTGAVGIPFFEDFTNPVDAPAAKTPNLISSIIFKMRQSSLKAYFQSKLGTKTIRKVGMAKTEEYFLGRSVFFMAANRKNKT